MDGDEDEEPDFNHDDSQSQTYLDVIRDFLEQKGLLYDSYMLEEISMQRGGKHTLPAITLKE